jgi:hypothetical protein
MAYVTVPEEYNFTTEFPTWIIAYCPDTNSWFCTNQRFFYYEYPDEFQCENDAINYFENHIDEFIKLSCEIWRRKVDRVFLENTRKEYIKR